MNWCPKCSGEFSRIFGNRLCDKHQKEYEDCKNEKYIPDEKCYECGRDSWEKGELQMTDPPSYPTKKVYKCSLCACIRLMRSSSGSVRIYESSDYKDL